MDKSKKNKGYRWFIVLFYVGSFLFYVGSFLFYVGSFLFYENLHIINICSFFENGHKLQNKDFFVFLYFENYSFPWNKVVYSIFIFNIIIHQPSFLFTQFVSYPWIFIENIVHFLVPGVPEKIKRFLPWYICLKQININCLLSIISQLEAFNLFLNRTHQMFMITTIIF